MAALEIAAGIRQRWRAGLPHLANDRVLLRELQRSDAENLYRVVCIPDVARHTWPPPTTPEAFEQFVEWTWAERACGRYVCFGIVPHGETSAFGLFELRQLQPQFFRAELGFFLDSALWGTGIFGSAASLLIGFATEVLRVHRIEARASVDNLRSNAALRKLGARHEGVLRAAFVCDGKYVDQNLWGLVAGLDHHIGRRERHARRPPIHW